MKQFIRENYALVAGIALPLILMVLFLVAGKTAEMTVAPPQHDVLFVGDYYYGNSNSMYLVRVENNKLVIRVNPPQNPNDPRPQPPRLWRYDHVTGTSKPLPIDFSNVKDGVVADPYLETLNQSKLSDTPISPDGYTLEQHRGGNGGLPGEIFGFGRGYHYDANYTLVKKPRVVPLNPSESIYQAQFLAWVEGPAQ